MDFIVEFFNDFNFLITNVIPQFFNDGVVYLGKLFVYAGLYLKLSGITLSFEIAESIMSDLDISHHIQQSFSFIDSQSLLIANYFKIPAFIEILITAYTTRFVMGFLR